MPSIEARCEHRRSSAETFAVRLDSSERFSSIEACARDGFILPKFRQLVDGLLAEATLMLYTSCTLELASNKRSTVTTSAQVSCTLDITVHGPYELFDEIGEWFQEYNVYLQDPRICHLDVRYCNPHKLSSQDLGSSPFVSHVVAHGSTTIHFQELVERPDLLDIISGQEDLAEAMSPCLLSTVLHRYALSLE